MIGRVIADFIGLVLGALITAYMMASMSPARADGMKPDLSFVITPFVGVAMIVSSVVPDTHPCAIHRPGVGTESEFAKCTNWQPPGPVPDAAEKK